MDQLIAQYIAAHSSLVVDVDIFVDESAADNANCILVRTMDAVSQYVGIQIFDTTVLICNYVFDTARTNATLITSMFNALRGISGSSWGTIGNVVNRFEGTDTLKRTVYAVTFKIGKQEV